MLMEVFYISMEATCASTIYYYMFHDIIEDHVDDIVVKSGVATGYF